jgi:hypothetical protein
MITQLILIVFIISSSGPSTTSATSKKTTSATTTMSPENLPQLNSFKKIVLPKNHWSFNGNYNDSFGNANLISGVNFGLTSDRYGNPNSALSLNNGYMIVPGGQVYFSGDFSFISWIFWRKTLNWARIIDFGNGDPGDNIQICSFENRNRIFVGIAQGKNDSSFNNPLITKNPISLNTWYHIAYVQSGNKGTLYLNGTAVVTNTLSPPLSVVRNSNFIGKSNWVGNDLVNAVFDEMKIFDVALSEAQVIHDYRFRPTTFEKRK